VRRQSEAATALWIALPFRVVSCDLVDRLVIKQQETIHETTLNGTK
jgi:hypothetical protein